MAFTVAARPSKPRMGTEHTYRLNGSLLRDVLVDGRWMTMRCSTKAPLTTTRKLTPIIARPVKP